MKFAEFLVESETPKMEIERTYNTDDHNYQARYLHIFPLGKGGAVIQSDIQGINISRETLTPDQARLYAAGLIAMADAVEEESKKESLD